MTGQPYDLGPWVTPHYALLAHVLHSYQPYGVALEFGVGKGESTRLIAAHMPVVGFDSFKGLPEKWRKGFPKGMFAQAEPPCIPHCELVEGLFEDTLPGWHIAERVGLVHIDCDLYSSTATVLFHIGPLLRKGTIVVFDEWYGYRGCEKHEQRAWREHVEATGTTWKVLGHSFQQWAVQIT